MFRGAKPTTTSPTMAFNPEEKSDVGFRRLVAEFKYKWRLQNLRLSRLRASSSSSFFPLFAKLPVELRLKIWHYATPEPYTHQQMIPCRSFEYVAHKLAGQLPPIATVGFTKSAPTPALLHTCRESRNEFLYITHPTRISHGQEQHPLFGLVFANKKGRASFFSWEQDTMLINYPQKEFVSPIMRGLRRVSMWEYEAHALNLSPRAIGTIGVTEWMSGLLDRFPNIETFTILYLGPPKFVGNRPIPPYLLALQHYIDGLIASEQMRYPNVRSLEVKLIEGRHFPLALRTK